MPQQRQQDHQHPSDTNWNVLGDIADRADRHGPAALGADDHRIYAWWHEHRPEMLEQIRENWRTLNIEDPQRVAHDLRTHGRVAHAFYRALRPETYRVALELLRSAGRSGRESHGTRAGHRRRRATAGPPDSDDGPARPGDRRREVAP